MIFRSNIHPCQYLTLEKNKKFVLDCPVLLFRWRLRTRLVRRAGMLLINFFSFSRTNTIIHLDLFIMFYICFILFSEIWKKKDSSVLIH